jgi:flagellar biosynthesis activator protein FlaF
MSQFNYGDIASDNQALARRREAEALAIIVKALGHAEQSSKQGDVESALDLHDRLWSIFLEDLAHEENMLPEPVRAGIISVGLWSLRESLRIRIEGGALLPLIEINEIVGRGLSH